MTTTPTHAGPAVPAYGLHRPTIGEAHEAVERVYGAQSHHVWGELLATAGLAGTETDLPSVHRLIDTMRGSREPVVALCAQALAIRLSAFEHLSATDAIVRNATP